jgi:hypothetical protein
MPSPTAPSYTNEVMKKKNYCIGKKLLKSKKSVIGPSNHFIFYDFLSDAHLLKAKTTKNTHKIGFQTAIFKN